MQTVYFKVNRFIRTEIIDQFIVEKIFQNFKMPAVAKKVAKAAKNSKSQKQQQNDVEAKKPKKQSLKKVQKTAGIVAAKKLAKLNSKKAVSDTVSCFFFFF